MGPGAIPAQQRRDFCGVCSVADACDGLGLGLGLGREALRRIVAPRLKMFRPDSFVFSSVSRPRTDFPRRRPTPPFRGAKGWLPVSACQNCVQCPPQIVLTTRLNAHIVLGCVFTVVELTMPRLDAFTIGADHRLFPPDIGTAGRREARVVGPPCGVASLLVAECRHVGAVRGRLCWRGRSTTARL
jgi:hypothetical protein